MNSKKKIIIIIVVAIILAIGGGIGWYYLYKVPHDAAVAEYESAVAIIEEKNAVLDGEIAEIQAVIDSGEEPYEEETLVNAYNAITNANDEKIVIGEMPKGTKDIISATGALDTEVDYSKCIKKLDEAQEALEISIQQLKNVTNPTATFVMNRLKNVEGVVDSQAVTEDNDPNKQLNKAGGYTAAVFFQHSDVNQSKIVVIGKNDIVGKGTQCGGAVEVFASVEDANKRNDYLATFDGGVLSSGSHTVVGTCVIRTSKELTATKQKETEAAVTEALLAVE